MKKTLLILVGLIFLVSISSFAQSQSTSPSDVFVKTVPIVKVYTHALGYKVVYVKSNLEVGSIYLPLTWFGKAAGKGMIIWDQYGALSYFSIFWVDGKFDHIVLHVPANMQNTIWGELNTSEDLTSQFSIEEPKLSF